MMMLLLLGSLLAIPASAITKAPSIFPNVTTGHHPFQQASGDPGWNTAWAGATKYSKDTTFVSAEIVVPEPQVPPGGNVQNMYSTAFWVGIDGYSCGHAILQTGITSTIEGGERRYSAWFEWFPTQAYNFDLEVKAGDRVRLAVGATSSTSGWALVDNLSTGKHAQHDFTGQVPLCLTEADWVVEQYTAGGKVVPIAAFGPVQFANAWALQDKKEADVKGSRLLSIVESDHKTLVTGCGFEGEESLRCFYLK